MGQLTEPGTLYLSAHSARLVEGTLRPEAPDRRRRRVRGHGAWRGPSSAPCSP